MRWVNGVCEDKPKKSYWGLFTKAYLRIGEHAEYEVESEYAAEPHREECFFEPLVQSENGDDRNEERGTTQHGENKSPLRRVQSVLERVHGPEETIRRDQYHDDKNHGFSETRSNTACWRYFVSSGGRVLVGSRIVIRNDDDDVGDKAGITVEGFNGTERADQHNMDVESFASSTHDKHVTNAERLNQNVDGVQRENDPNI